MVRCVEWVEDTRRCGEPADHILWGKLFPPDALGPRCTDCALKHVDSWALNDSSYAIFDLRPVRRLVSALEQVTGDVERLK